MEFFPLLFLLFLFALLYFTTIRPQQKRQKEINAMLDALERVMKYQLQAEFLER